MRGLNIPKLKGGDLFRYIKRNKELLIHQKKSSLKEADGICFNGPIVDKLGNVTKGGVGVKNDDGTIRQSLVINTCYWYDSHGDVHIPGIWNKSLADNAKRRVNQIFLLQEHKMLFEKIIADKSDVLPYTKNLTWRQLGYDYEGETEALIFDAIIRPNRNPYMYNQYKDGHVTNHSVGMYYVDMHLAIGYKDKEFKEENDVWDKYFDKIPNKDDVMEDMVFWAITQAKVIEGSSVVKGSNVVTPVLGDISTLNEPVTTTHEEPKSLFELLNKIY